MLGIGVPPVIDLTEYKHHDLALFKLEFGYSGWTEQSSSFELFNLEGHLGVGHASVIGPDEVSEVEGETGGLEECFAVVCTPVGNRVVLDNLG